MLFVEFIWFVETSNPPIDAETNLAKPSEDIEALGIVAVAGVLIELANTSPCTVKTPLLNSKKSPNPLLPNNILLAVTSPNGVKWNPLELTSKLPPLPLINCELPPKKKVEELISRLSFSNFIKEPVLFPIKALGLPLLCSNCIPVFPNVTSCIDIFLLPASNRISVPLDNLLASIVQPAISPPVNWTLEPVICPLSFNFKIEPTAICPSLTVKPPAVPPLNCNADAVTAPPAFTLKFDDDIKNWFPLAAPLMKKLSDEIAPPPMVNPPNVPALAVTFPDITTLPLLSKWKLEELISIFPFEPLTNCDKLPKKNLGACIFTELPLSVVSPVLNILILPLEPLIKLLGPPSPNAEELILVVVPSNFIWLPLASPINTAGELPLKNIPLFVPSIPVGRGLPADIKPPPLELINKLFDLNANTSTSISATDAVTSKLSDLILTPVESAWI